MTWASLRHGEGNTTVLTPHTAADWPKIIARAKRKPPTVSSNPSDAQLDELADFALSSGPFVSDDVKRVGEVIRRVRRANDLAPVGGRRAVIVNGDFHQGKTHTALIQAIRDVDAARCVESPHAVIPWVYVELSASGRGRSVSEAVLRFVGAPMSARATMPDLVRVLRLLAPEIQLAGVIIDDLGSTEGAGGKEQPGAMATALKSMVMQVPATFVLIGTALSQARMFSAVNPIAPAQQVLRRSTWIELEPWSAPGNKPGPWHRLVATMSNHLPMPGHEDFAIKNHRGVCTLHELSEGRPGSAMELVQHAAATAILSRCALDVPMLRQTAKDLRGDRA